MAGDGLETAGGAGLGEVGPERSGVETGSRFGSYGLKSTARQRRIAFVFGFSTA